MAPTAECGDGVVQAPEECDDGNVDNKDECTHLCTYPLCGDSIISSGEVCDDGNAENSDACSNSCQLSACGDSQTQPNEECDNGPLNSDDGACTAICTLAKCGDGLVWLDGDEQCDLGAGNSDNSACTLGCKSASCGDGLLHVGHETCEVGTTDDLGVINCRADCTYCGDGAVNAEHGEECDGELTPNGACLPGCTEARCGDGLLHVGVEECDDANDSNADSCTNNCEKTQRRVFVTAPLYSGNLGGYPGATSFCQSQAKAAGLTTVIGFKAWLSDGNYSPSTILDTGFEGLYVRVDGKVVAHGWTDLTDGQIDYPIDIGPSGAPSPSTYAWTGTAPDGSALIDTNCSGFMSSDKLLAGYLGALSATDESWTQANIQACSNNFAIYCFEDP